MDRRTFLLNMCRHADGTVDGARFAHLCNRWSPQARAASIGVRMARYGSGFAPSARAAAAVAARARGGKVMAPGGRDGYIEAGGQAPGSESRVDVPPSKVMAPGGRGGFIEAGGQAPGAEPRGNVPPGKVMAPGGRGGFIEAGGQAPGNVEKIWFHGNEYEAMPDGRLLHDLRRSPGDNKGFEPGGGNNMPPAGYEALDVNGKPVNTSMRGNYAPNPGANRPGPGAAALEGQQFRVNGGLYYVKDGVLTKAWSDGGTQAKQGGRGGKFLPRENEGRETATNLEILRKAGVVLPDGSGGSKPDDRRRYMR